MNISFIPDHIPHFWMPYRGFLSYTGCWDPLMSKYMDSNSSLIQNLSNKHQTEVKHTLFEKCTFITLYHKEKHNIQSFTF